MSGLKSNHASAVRFSPYKVKLWLAGNDEIKFKTVPKEPKTRTKEMNPTGHAHAQCSAGQSAVMNFFFFMAFINCFADGQPFAGSKRKEVKCFTDMHNAIR